MPEIEFETPDGPTSATPFDGAENIAAHADFGRNTFLELAAKPTFPVWQDIAMAGSIVVLAGGPGGGKTTLLFLLLAARLTRGEPLNLLGRRVAPVPHGRYVLLIEGEHSSASTARKLIHSLGVLGVADDALDHIIVLARKSVRIGSAAWDEIGRMVAAGIISDIALDTLARVAPSDANDEKQQVEIFEEITRTIELAPSDEAKPVVWAIAHTRKGGGDHLDAVSGSTQRVGQADTVLLVQPELRDGRVASTKVVFAKIRESTNDHPPPVEYIVRDDGVTMVNAPRDDRPLEERILARLALGPQTKSALRNALSRSSKDVEEALTNLFAAKAIRSTEVKLRNGVFKAFEMRSAKREPSGPTTREYGAHDRFDDE